MRTGTTADTFVETTLEVIAEESGAGPVNLRRISRRIGCAHTNVYNYFEDFDALRWAAYQAALDVYVMHLTEDAPTTGPARTLLRRLVERLASFPIKHTGLFRFISTDRMAMETIPKDVLGTIGHMKHAYVESIAVAGGRALIGTDAQDVADIMLAYLTGESMDTINQRVLPGEDIPARVVDNTMRLFDLLVAEARERNGAEPEDPERIVDFPEIAT